MRKRFARWLCADLYGSVSVLKETVEVLTATITQNDKALLEMSSEVNDLRNQIAERQKPVDPQPQFHSGRGLPRSMRAERPRTGVTQ